MNSLPIPNSDVSLLDGNIVVLSVFPKVRWIVRYGWYVYHGLQTFGWSFVSILEQKVLPVTDSDLESIVLVDTGEYVPPCPVPPEPGPFPPPPPPVPYPPPGSDLFPFPFPDPETPPYNPFAYFTKNDKYLLDASWITLPSIEHRDALSTICTVPNGKIVMIIDEEGVTHYYSWNAYTKVWDEKFFENDPSPLSDYYTKSEVDQIVSEINGDITTLQSGLQAESAARAYEDNLLSSDFNSLSESVDSRISKVESDVSKLAIIASGVIIASSRWTESGKVDYLYKAVISMSEVDTNYFVTVQFRDEDVQRYDFSPDVTVGKGTITIYCKEIPSSSIVVSNITCFLCTAVSAS